MSEQDDILDRVFAVIESRKGADASSSYVASLYAKGREKITGKVTEEAGELVQAALGEGDARTVSESADLLFHMMVLWAEMGLTPDDIRAELARREGISGHDEKASRTR